MAGVGIASGRIRRQARAFQHQQFFTKAIELKVDGKPVKGFPMWWPRRTGSKPVTGPLAPADPNSPGSLTGKIALVKIPEVPGTSILPGNIVHQVIEPVQKSGALGIVAIILSPTGEIVEQNAMSGLAKWSVPIMIVGQSDEAMFDQAAARIASCSLLMDGQYKDEAEAFEVIRKLTRGKKLVVVTTPSSGWFHCAGERGPGIALWLGLARWAARQKSDLSYQFVASSGHELHGAGIEEFMRREPPPRDSVLCWLHLGAGIATYDYKKTGQGLQKQPTASPLPQALQRRKIRADPQRGFRRSAGFETNRRGSARRRNGTHGGKRISVLRICRWKRVPSPSAR